MKKKMVVTIIALVLSVSAFAQSDFESQDRIKLLVNDSLQDNFDLIIEESQYLTNGERLDLFDELSYTSKQALAPFALNTLLGFGIGSFVQEHYTAAWIGFGLDLTGAIVSGVGLTFFVVGYFQFFPSLFTSVLTAGNETGMIDAGSQNLIIGTNILITGFAILAGSRIYQMITPWTYKASYNRDLRDALGVDDIAFNILPHIDGETGETEFVASVAIKL